MRYALDADVIIHLQKSQQVPALKALGLLPVLITDVVWDELTTNAVDLKKHVVDERLELLEAIAGAPTELMPATPEALDFTRLDAPSFGAGERSMIAYAKHHPEVALVLIDKLALHRAIEELRGQRILSLHGMLRELEPHGLTRAIAEAVSSSFCKANKPHRPPLWW